MKTFLLWVIFGLIICSSAFAQGANQIMLLDGSIVGASNPLPSVSTSTGTTTIVEESPTTNSTTVVSVTSSPQNVASLADRKSFGIFNTSSTITAWVSLDASTASASVGLSIPVLPYGFVGGKLADSKVISIVASEAITATVYQDAE